MKLNIGIPNIKRAEDAFGNRVWYIEFDKIQLIIREGELVGWYRPGEADV